MTKPKDTSGPAFPSSNREVHHSELNGPWVSGRTFTGLTKREYFAAMAMQGVLANAHAYTDGSGDRLIEVALECADALLAALGGDQ